MDGPGTPTGKTPDTPEERPSRDEQRVTLATKQREHRTAMEEDGTLAVPAGFDTTNAYLHQDTYYGFGGRETRKAWLHSATRNHLTAIGTMRRDSATADWRMEISPGYTDRQVLANFARLDELQEMKARGELPDLDEHLSRIVDPPQPPRGPPTTRPILSGS